MRILIIILIFSCCTIKLSAQYSSYQDRYDQVKMGFDLSMSMNNSTLMFISALAEYEIQIRLGMDRERSIEMKKNHLKALNARIVNCIKN